MEYVSIIAPNLVQPLADILAKVVDIPTPEDPDQPRHGNELGYSAVASLLCTVILESFVMRARFLANHGETAKKHTVHSFLSEQYPDFDAVQEVTEVFILRDVIAHNHLWRLESTSDRNVWTELLRKELDAITEAARDKKYKQLVDPSIGRTRLLCLHVIPTQIDRTDLKKVLNVARNTLNFLSTKEGALLGVEATQAQFRGNLVNLPNLLAEVLRAI